MSLSEAVNWTCFEEFETYALLYVSVLSEVSEALTSELSDPFSRELGYLDPLFVSLCSLFQS